MVHKELPYVRSTSKRHLAPSDLAAWSRWYWRPRRRGLSLRRLVGRSETAPLADHAIGADQLWRLALCQLVRPRRQPTADLAGPACAGWLLGPDGARQSARFSGR